jgi:hypothetical protein
MNAALTPPFPIAGAGVLLAEAVVAVALVSSFWATSPEGFREIGAMLAVLLLASWALAYSLGRKALSSPRHIASTKRTVILGGALGLSGLVLGFLGGPHIAGICVWGVGLQVVVLLVGKAVSAT